MVVATPRALYVVGPILAAAILVFDLSTELGIAAGVPYVLLVLMTLGRGMARHTLPAVATGVVLTLVGWELSPEGGETAKVAANRLLAILAVVATGYAVRLKHTADRKLDIEVAENAALEAKMRDTQALAQLGALASTVAHEVKNPLAGIAGAVQILGKRLPEDVPEQVILERITDRIGGLVEWIDDMLRYARPADPHPRRVDGAMLVRDTVELFAAADDMADVDVSLDLAPNIPLDVDPDLVQRALLNLLLNAGQATEGHGRVDVRLSNGGDRVVLEVADDGPGVPEELRERVFEPFFSRRQGPRAGTGLGLPSVRRTVEAHGGHVTLRCPDGGGTAVRIDLPAAG